MIKCQICGDAAHYLDHERELIACEECIRTFGEPYVECHDCGSNITASHYHYEKHVFCQKCYKDRTKAEFDSEDDPEGLGWH